MSDSDADLQEDPGYIIYQKAIISANLNSTIFLAMIMGMYFIVFLGTMHIYFSRKKEHNKAVMGTIIALFLLVLAQVSINWYFVNHAIVEAGDTRFSIFVESTTVPPAMQIGTMFCQYLGYILADGLMVWRCYQMCGRLWLRVSPTLILFVGEIALCITSITMNNTNIDDHSDAHTRLVNKVTGSLSALVAATSVFATVTITYCIVTATSQDKYARKRYMRIADIVLQSSAVYSLSAVGLAVLALVPSESVDIIAGFSGYFYLSALTSIFTGFAPTLMVARVALLSMNHQTHQNFPARRLHQTPPRSTLSQLLKPHIVWEVNLLVRGTS
ncbi:hypothetical protein D9613_007340 [Agrocybe pediades]|uniref:Uncharacterized protein n=1 Tax=Agrocybe pediades TaxID=84607 RepID=A0A8H4VIR2_9AGAR|nr:hypothetical protein D9613_007340 [Agrocybe pediades]